MDCSILLASTNVMNAVEATQESMPWVIGDGFMFIEAALFCIIAIVFAHRLNKLDTTIGQLNAQLQGINKTLTEVSQRPCQLESHGFCVEVKDPTGKKLDEIKKHHKPNKPNNVTG